MIMAYNYIIENYNYLRLFHTCIQYSYVHELTPNYPTAFHTNSQFSFGFVRLPPRVDALAALKPHHVKDSYDSHVLLRLAFPWRTH